MPLDSTTMEKAATRSPPLTLESVLAKAGITPVPLDVLAKHKADILAKYAHRVHQGARWMTRMGHDSLMFIDHYTSPAPAAVSTTLRDAEVRLIEQGVNVEREGGWFYPDPYIGLRLTTKHGRDLGHVCLAIWNGKVVLHQATLGEAYNPPAPRRSLKKMLGLGNMY